MPWNGTTYARWSDPAFSARVMQDAMGVMRERTPSSGFGFLLTLIVFIAATYLILTNLVEKFPRP